MDKWVFGIVCMVVMAGCNKPSKVEQYRAEKHVRDSIALVEQQRSLAYYETQLDLLLPKADSLLPLFKYEKNEKDQDHGYYVVTVPGYGLRVLVRDDGEELLLYRNGKRVKSEGVKELKSEREQEAYERAQELYVVMRDIKELEKRIAKTSLEVQKYQKRLQNTDRPTD